MNQLSNAAALLQIKDQQAMADSLGVAQHFEKQHKDVLRSIQNLDCSEEFSQRNFAPSTYRTERGKDYPMYLMTRDGFSFLVMGFTGPKAAQWKEKYIAAFNAIEAELRQEQQESSLVQTERELLDVYRDHLRLLKAHKKRGSKITLEEKRQIWQLTYQGYSHHYIARKLGRDAANIRRWQKLYLQLAEQKIAEIERRNRQEETAKA